MKKEQQAKGQDKKSKKVPICQNCQMLEGKIKEQQAREINLAKQHRNELGLALKFKNQELITALLPVLDSLEASLNFPNPNPQTAMFLKGIKISLTEMKKILVNFHLEKIASKVGAIYNPELEETIDSEWDPTKPENSILKIKRAGYQVRGRVVRPVQVIINQKKSKEKKGKL